MILSLPIDLLQMILEALDDGDSLAQCCRASKLLLAISRPLLYEQATFRIRDDTEQVARGVDGSVPKLLVSSHDMLRRFENHTHLAALVQDISLSVVYPSDERKSRYIGDATYILKEVVRVLPNLKNIYLVNSIHLDGFDTTIAQSQLHNSSFPCVHVDHSYPSIEQSLTAVYASLGVGASSLTLNSPFASISRSITSLKVVCGFGFYSYLTLSNLDHLRRLEFCTPNIRARKSTGGPPRYPPSRYKAIFNELSHLTTLRKVVFSGDDRPTFNLIENPDRLFSSIPSGVIALSIQRGGVYACHLAQALQSLSSSSGIRTMEIHSVEGELSEVREECDKRGIRLVII
ncbi:hypothetical protein JCM5353_000748 [Sporobolomyces roseus]